MTMHELCVVLVNYIENNKVKYNISYEESFRAIKENLENIIEEYKNAGVIAWVHKK